MSSDNSIPTNFAEQIISASLNSSMLYNLAMGMYTMLYGGTFYLYVSRKTAHAGRRTVLWAISALYFFTLLVFIMQWYQLNSAFVLNGETRDSIFFAISLVNPQWMWQASVILLNFTLAVADGLLVWRCYHVWGQSLKVALVPSMLFLAEIGLTVTSAVLNSIFGEITYNEAETKLANNITCALDFISLGTTVTCTCLIWYRIHSTLRLGGPSAKGPIIRALILIVESAALYSAVLLLDAVSFVVPAFSKEESPLFEFGYYITILLNMAAGIAPTIMVARLAFMNQKPDTRSLPITHVSNLNFHHSSDTAGSAAGVADTEPKSVSSATGSRENWADQYMHSIARFFTPSLYCKKFDIMIQNRLNRRGTV
ncbi:hypothetical protein JR316_0007517 [Psilocybe cubensis]|uniref:Uncharacterized protein n=2 Tax=Psilocybe cubensis TaxID=181762 RepID=A0A8H8CHH2_PSICU|nr:hypothetical protein JR316_0007517 [Psilocybe cubensis]KAH9480915.1 hypothetical protein JR316_0007517 [Psilocybe cubensis]